MGLFNNYLKPGPGIPKDAPEKKGIFLFTEILGRKFFDLIKVNFMCFLISVPFYVIVYFLIAPQYMDLILNGLDVPKDSSLFVFNIMCTVLLFNFYGAGPMSAVYSFVTRSFTNSKPIFWFSDGFDKFKENFRQSIILVVIDIIVLFCMGVVLRICSYNYGTVYLWMHYIILVAAVIYIFAHIFIYQIMVTYDCSTRDLIGNALVIALAKLPMCILLIVITTAIYLIMYRYLSFFAIIVYATVGMSFIRFPLEFYATRVIKKNMEQTATNE